MDELLISQITEAVMKSLNNGGSSSQTMNDSQKPNGVPIGISGRHIHLTEEHINVLFGQGYELQIKKILMGGQYAAEECVTIVSSKLKAIENVRVLGPVRKASQVEISKTDAIKLGINAPFRESGDIKGSAPISIIGPKGSIYLNEGCIIAKRHIHMSPADASKYGVSDKQVVTVSFGGERAALLQEVLIRVDKTFTLEMHIDTDEANGLGLNPKSMAYIVK